jgi:hypothetical protein
MWNRFAGCRTLMVLAALGTLLSLVIAAAEPAATTQPTPPSAEQVLKEVLDNHQPVQPLLPSEPGRPVKSVVSTRPVNPVAAEQERQDLLPDGYPVKRTGRLVYDGAWWTLTTEATGQTIEPEKPLRILPNRLLETMEATSGGGARPMIFTVTGQVTEYRGTNYLLVLNVMIKRDQGNLSK